MLRRTKSKKKPKNKGVSNKEKWTPKNSLRLNKFIDRNSKILTEEFLTIRSTSIRYKKTKSSGRSKSNWQSTSNGLRCRRNKRRCKEK